MKLHRIEGRPEWAKDPKSRQNVWQRTARETNGIITLGNVITIAGFIVAIVGLWMLTQHHYWAGLVYILVGRSLDLADGYAADKTRTKSPIGEALDASVDKLITLLTLITFFVVHITSWLVLLAVLLPHLIISIIAALQVAKGKRLHPSRLGKYSMALAWAGLGGLLLTRAVGAQHTSALSIAGYACIAVSVALGFGALVGYIRAAEKV